MARGWLAYVKFMAEDMGVRVIDREFYLTLPDLDIHVRLSPRTGYPVFYIRDGNELSDIICYYNRRYRRYMCLHRRLVEGIVITDYQAHYVLAFERCYKERKGRGSSSGNNLHVECHSTKIFTTRDINKHIRESGFRGLRSLESLLDFFVSLRDSLDSCCYYECYAGNFSNADDLVLLADTHLAYHSRDRFEDTCYMDRCEGVRFEVFPMVCVG